MSALLPTNGSSPDLLQGRVCANKGLMHRSRYRSSLCQDRFLTGTSWLERVRDFWNLPRSMRRTHEEESAPTISFVVIIALA